MYEMFNAMASSAFGIISIVMGIRYLFIPYDTLKKKMRKIKSPATIRRTGILFLVFGVLMIFLGVQRMIN